MGHRTANRSRGGTFEGTELEDLRRQLEGGLETLEEASARYRTLSSSLRRGDWKARLRNQRALLETARAREPEVLEALAALRRRAAREPVGAGGVEAVLRDMEAARGALEGALTRRLSEAADAPLAERLALLDARAIQPLLLPPREGEQRLAEGTAMRLSLGMRILLLPLLVLCSHFAGTGPTIFLILVVALLGWLSSSRYQLTSERLLLRPLLGEPVEVPLASIGDGELSVRPFLGSIRLKAHGVTLRHLRRSKALAALMSIRRRKEFRQATAAVASRDRLVLEARCRLNRGRVNSQGVVSDSEELAAEDYGYLVLSSRWIAFLPCRYTEASGKRYGPRAGAVLLNALTEPTAPSNVPEWKNRDAVAVSAREVMEHLERLPEEALERLLRRAAAHPQGPSDAIPFLLWDPAEVECSLGVMPTLAISQGGYTLSARLNGKTHQEAGRIVAGWPRRESSTKGPHVGPPYPVRFVGRA